MTTDEQIVRDALAVGGDLPFERDVTAERVLLLLAEIDRLRAAIKQEREACEKTAMAEPVAYYNSNWTLTPQAYAEAKKRNPELFEDMKPAYAAPPG